VFHHKQLFDKVLETGAQGVLHPQKNKGALPLSLCFEAVPSGSWIEVSFQTSRVHTLHHINHSILMPSTSPMLMLGDELSHDDTHSNASLATESKS
jgi:hypothetical protein